MDGRIIIKWALEQGVGYTGSEFIWFIVGTSGAAIVQSI
jgi:hypothetical protein